MQEGKAIILAKIESAYGVDPSPTLAANAILCSALSIEILGASRERAVVLPYYGKLPPIAVGEGIKISFEVEVRGPGALPDTPTRISHLLRACNLTETHDHGSGTEKCIYTPNSLQDGESTTVYFYRDGLFHRLLGAVGNAKISAKASEVGKISFEMTGLYSPFILGPPVFTGAGLNDLTRGGVFSGAVTRDIRVQIDGTGTPDTFEWSDDGGSTWEATLVPITGAAQTLAEGITVTFAATTGHTSTNRWDFTAMPSPIGTAAFSSPTFGDADIPPIFKSAALLIDTYAGICSAVNIDFGNVISKRVDVNHDPVIIRYFISGHQVKGDVDPEVVALSTYNPWTSWAASTPGEISLQIGTATQNRMKITLPSCVKETPKYGGREGSLIYTIPFSANPTLAAGNNAISIVFD